jgi:hypothetical protein
MLKFQACWSNLLIDAKSTFAMQDGSHFTMTFKLKFDNSDIRLFSLPFVLLSCYTVKPLINLSCDISQ